MRALRVTASMVFLAVVVSAAAQERGPAPSSILKPSFGTLPIYFIENRGVYPDAVKFYIPGRDKTLFFNTDGITFRLKGKDRAHIVKLDFIGANPEARPEGQEKQVAVFSYFAGPKEDWKTGLRTYSRIVYRDLWPGIDLVYHGVGNQLKYEFVVKPGADPGKVRLKYRGAMCVSITEAGGLRIETPVGRFEDQAPVSFQEVNGERVPVESAFRSRGRTRDGAHLHGFHVGPYDATRPLVLDPAVLVYCGYLGGDNADAVRAVAVDASGDVYVAGTTNSSPHTFPLTVGPGLTHGGGSFPGDAFVAKLRSDGSGLVYCGYIGGSALDVAEGIAVDSQGRAVVGGYTQSTETTFPVKTGPDLTYNGGHCDAFVARVTADGSGLDYCGYIGGSSGESCDAVGTGPNDVALVAGSTDSAASSFPVRVGPALTLTGGIDAYVARVNPTGTGLDYCGYVGGASQDQLCGLAVDPLGNAYITGHTSSSQATFPVRVGPGLTLNGRLNAFVARVNADGKGLGYCGYIGGYGDDLGLAIAVDQYGCAYVAGSATSAETAPSPNLVPFPVTVGPGLHHAGGSDAFVAKVNPSGSALVYCGYIGGSGAEAQGRAGIAVDAAGHACVGSDTYSSEATFPVRGGPDLTHNGFIDVFVARVHPTGTGLDYCGYIGGTAQDSLWGLAASPTGNVIAAGSSLSSQSSFPVRIGPDLTFNGNGDGFVAKVSFTSLTGTGAGRPGASIQWDLTATDCAGLRYQLGSSLGTGPIRIDTRTIDLSADNLLAVSVAGLWPAVFSGYQGIVDGNGQAQAAIHVPNLPALIGTPVHTAFVTLDPAAPSGIRSISNTVSFVIAK